MGSDSDWPKIKAAAEALDEFGVAYEVQVMSAHRTPEVVRQYATMAAARGLRVIIAAAGGAAHLAGVVASHTTLPVIGIPVPTELLGRPRLLALHGADARRRARGHRGRRRRGPRNAGLLAVEILALADADLQQKLIAFRHELGREGQRQEAAALQEDWIRGARRRRTRATKCAKCVQRRAT